MIRSPLDRNIDALITATVYLAAVTLAVPLLPLLALDGVQRVRRWLGVNA